MTYIYAKIYEFFYMLHICAFRMGTYDVVFFSELKGIEELFQDTLSRPLAGLELGMLCNIVAAFQIFSGDDFISRHIHLGKCLVD